jgi:hypothetical protein
MQEEITPSNVLMEGSNATVKGKEKALDEPEALVVRPIEEVTTKDNSQPAMAFQVVPSASSAVRASSTGCPTAPCILRESNPPPLGPPNPAFSEVRTWLNGAMT